jgi:hypothetical protein
VGVLAALVFIGIVVAAMVRNTGSQSAASRGYGTAATMNSTTASGVVATESFMQNEDFTEAALQKIQDYLDFENGKTTDPNKKNPFIFGDSHQKRKLADRQFFRSRLVGFDTANAKYAMFEVESGKNASGKSLNKARVFYIVENLKIDGQMAWPGGNTLLLDTELEYSNGTMDVVGNATFLKNVSIAKAGVAFKPKINANGTKEGNVFFKEQIKFDKGADFQVPAFFNDDAIFTGYGANNNMFKTDAAFNKNLSTGSEPNALEFGGNVWVKDGFMATNWMSTGTGQKITYSYDMGQRININGTGTNKDLFYGSNLPSLNADGSYAGSPCASRYPDVQPYQYDRACFEHNTANLNAKSGVSITGMKAAPTTLVTESILRGLGMANEADAAKNKADPAAGAAAANARVKDEPTLDPSILTAAPPNGLGKKFAPIATLQSKCLGALDLACVNSWYSHPDFSMANHPEYYNEGHLLVKVDKNIQFNVYPTDVFNNKIALILDGDNIYSGGNLSGKFFDSGPDASTLIYVGKNGRLNDFGCEKDFRGLIYVDPYNDSWNQQITFNWGPNSTIDGAVLLKGQGRINWNSGHTVITKNNDILNAFTAFIPRDPNAPAQNESVARIDETKPVRLVPAGYYYNLK